MNIIITGTSSGIGLETALYLAKQGHQILAISRKSSPKLTENPNIQQLNIDITQIESLEYIRNFIATQWKKVDILINNAGTLLNKPFEQISLEEFEYVYKVNVFAVVQLTQLTIPFMQKGAHVVNISSMGGVQGSAKFAGLSAYSSSKGALITLNELLAQEYIEQQISFNVLALGAVQTQMLEEAFPGYQAPITPDKMAEYIGWFALHGNTFHNGKTIQVSSTTP